RTLNQTKWKRRFFILTQTSLLLFRSDAQDEKSISRLAINSTSDTMVSDEEGATGRYILEVRTEREAEGAAAKNEDEEASGPGPRIWRLLSENEDVIMGWLIAVQDVIEREQIKAVQSTGNPAPSASASATSTPPPPLSNASTPISTPPRVSSVKRNPVPLGPVLAMLETKPSSSSSQPGIIPSPSSSKMSSDSPYLAKTHIYPTATAATSQVPTAVHHLHHLNPVMDRRPSVNATVQVTSAVASAAAVPQPVFMHSRSGSHGAMMMPPPAQPQQFVHARTISAGQVPPPPHMMQQQGYHYQPQQPIYQPQPTTTLHTFNQTPTAMVTASTISPMMLNATSSLQATNISPTSPTMYSQTSSISSSGSDRVVGAGAGAFSSKYKEVGVTSSGSNSSKKSGGGMDDLMMGGGSSNGSGSSSKKERKKDAHRTEKRGTTINIMASAGASSSQGAGNYQKLSSLSKEQEVEMQVQETIGIFSQNLLDVQNRGEHLQILEEKGKDLEGKTSEFKTNANKAKVAMWKKNLKMTIALIITVLVVVLIIVFYVLYQTGALRGGGGGGNGDGGNKTT
ncbi:hypothetical protein HDU97_006351, partial [Phlyctochytrium planicorne]